MNFATTHFIPRSWVKISDMVVLGIPRSASSSHTVSRPPLVIAAWTHSTASGGLLVPGLPDVGHFHRFQIIFEEFVPHCYLFCTHCVISKSLLNHPNSFCRGMFKLHAKFDADSLLYQLRCFECDSHTVHMLTQWHLLPPLTSTVKSSLFKHVHSSHSPWLPGYMDVMHNHSRYINNGWTFSSQTVYNDSRVNSALKTLYLLQIHHKLGLPCQICSQNVVSNCLVIFKGKVFLVCIKTS